MKFSGQLKDLIPILIEGIVSLIDFEHLRGNNACFCTEKYGNDRRLINFDSSGRWVFAQRN